MGGRKWWPGGRWALVVQRESRQIHFSFGHVAVRDNGSFRLDISELKLQELQQVLHTASTASTISEKVSHSFSHNQVVVLGASLVPVNSESPCRAQEPEMASGQGVNVSY